MGLHIMNYRAGIIDGTLEVEPEPVRADDRNLHLPVKPRG